ncbi:hypothetical protein N665_0158s0061 [Sinapis alba]|nr:hypothetical protein N665_0158s0061 [Sinapis alba]
MTMSGNLLDHFPYRSNDPFLNFSLLLAIKGKEQEKVTTQCSNLEKSEASSPVNNVIIRHRRDLTDTAGLDVGKVKILLIPRRVTRPIMKPATHSK